ncbi:hypothetical protein ETH99_04690 [Macrococcoides caseolyticum]|uniref:hypothetical protein n=1 Tax=Macrococcoides caseolyticum TaxID=69966 RepID=UPI00106111FF|nr:hypothetical protein [Macrococcus caseolyticus]TDM27658.1 hypothetical protein ETH99_04690 [Macrococcus caseolyticus]
MTLTRNLRLSNLEHWYMFPGSVYPEPAYNNTSLEVFIWEEDMIYILTITDIPEKVFFKNEDLISDIEGLAHHLVVEKGSTQFFEFITIDSSEGKRDESFDKAVYKLIKNKYPHLLINHHQKSFKYVDCKIKLEFSSSHLMFILYLIQLIFLHIEFLYD